ncbi:MAG: 50S ribosomal protein L1 [Candidatus Tyloplasma litorale]|nr:MAG: 50S ribosomal protein L1 [Mycoplasmatales bacterium]
MSKNYKAALAKVENKEYSIEEAIKLAKEISFEKFDPSFNLSMNLNLNTTHADQQLRGSLVLPHGTGKNSKVLVVVDSVDFARAKDAKADYVGGIELIEKIKNENWFDFDFIVTTPEFMPKLAKYGRLLGPKGLMPNPKLGTVTKNIEKIVSDIKKGQIEYKTDKEGIISVPFGKKSFNNQELVENFKTIFNLIKNKRPAVVKGTYIYTTVISTTMGPGIKVKVD